MKQEEEEQEEGRRGIKACSKYFFIFYMKINIFYVENQNFHFQ